MLLSSNNVKAKVISTGCDVNSMCLGYLPSDLITDLEIAPTIIAQTMVDTVSSLVLV